MILSPQYWTDLWVFYFEMQGWVCFPTQMYYCACIISYHTFCDTTQTAALSLKNLCSSLTFTINQTTRRRSPCPASWSEMKAFCVVRSLTIWYHSDFIQPAVVMCKLVKAFLYAWSKHHLLPLYPTKFHWGRGLEPTPVKAGYTQNKSPVRGPDLTVTIHLFDSRRQLRFSHGSSSKDGSAAWRRTAMCHHPGRLCPQLHVRNTFLIDFTVKFTRALVWLVLNGFI